VKNKKTLPFELMQNYIKDSRVDYQRNLSTLSKAYHHPCDAFCEEVLELICNHIGE
jgi:chromosome partitioning protein